MQHFLSCSSGHFERGSMMFEKIKRFFDLHLYTKKQIRQFCDKGVITLEQYKQITGEEY